MNKEQAEEYTQSLGQIVAGSYRQIAVAHDLGVPAALGMGVDDWVRDRLGGYIRMAIPERREAVKLLTDQGRSLREIGAILGVSHEQVRQDVNFLTTEREAATRARIAAERQAKDDHKREILEKKIEIDSRLHVGDFRKLAHLIPDQTAELVFTDPPYDRDAIPLYGAAALEAARILKPGGSMLCYCGHHILPEVLPVCSISNGSWIGADVHDGGPMTRMKHYGIIAGFNPIIWLVKGERGSTNFVCDTVLSPREKDVHPWQRSVKTARHFIEALTSPNGIVVDFFAGGGTTIIAARELNRQWIAFEINEDAAHAIMERLAAGSHDFQKFRNRLGASLV
jgi:16S rRNA G966 N2-methylase RsmD